MNDTDDELKTVAILTMQSPVALDDDEQWHRIAESFATRLQHPVLLLRSSPSEDFSQSFQRVVASCMDQGFRRFVVMPLGLEPFDYEELYSIIVWLRSEKRSVQLHIARCWSLQDIADAFGPGIQEAARTEAKSSVLLLAHNHSDAKVGLELSSLAFYFQQFDEAMDVHYAFLNGKNPSLTKVLQRMDSSGVQSVVLLTWRMDAEQSAVAVYEFGALHGLELTSEPYEFAWQWNRLSKESPQGLRLLERSGWIHIAIGIYLDALSARSNERYFAIDSTSTAKSESKIAKVLAELDQKVDSMLPTEYRGKLEEVRSQSMGSASIDSDNFGTVAWDEIWTSFCDLAMAGGPPHRGRLLEAVTSEQAQQNIVAYESVVQEIRRGIEMVTGLSTMRASTLGWVGVRCDDEAMAVWLMRAIIVENVMVRREGALLFLPAGPDFRVRKEIKNVITSVAKTVHYWRAHLRTR